jgi:hypothetical protein
VHGPSFDEPLVWLEGTGTSDRRFLAADERGSIIATANSSGTVTAKNTYDAYGAPAAGNTGRLYGRDGVNLRSSRSRATPAWSRFPRSRRALRAL